MNFGKRKEAEGTGNVLDESKAAAHSAAMPGKPFQSQLNPHLDEIRTLRRSRKTWDEIATELNTRYGLTTSGPSVFKFLKRRAARPAPFGFDELAGEPANATAPAAVEVDKAATSAEPPKLAIQKPRPRPPVQERKRIFDFSEEDIIDLEKNPILPTDKTE